MFLDAVHLPILLWAGNFWLLATSPRDAQAMYCKWSELLEARGWSIPMPEAKWCPSSPDKHFAEFSFSDSSGIVMPRALRSEGFKALGCFITLDGRNEIELRHRFSCAWGAFNKNRELFTNADVSLHKRVQLMTKCIDP